MRDPVWTLLWCAAFLALAVVPDQKILRWKLLAAEAGVGAVLLSVLASWLSAAGAAWLRTPLDLPVALYAAGGIFFYALSPERGASALELNRILFSAATFFAASQTIPRLKRPARVAGLWTASAALLGVYALLQTRGGFWVLAVPELERPIATFGNPIFFAAYLAASFAVALSMTRSASAASKVFFGVCAALIAAGLLTTQTRASVVGLGAALAAGAVLLGKGRARWAALFGALALGAAAAWWFRDRQWTHGLIWRDTVALWLSRPWLGCGLGRFHIEFPEYATAALRALWPEQKVIINYAHNEYLQVLAETGIVGFALLANLVVAALIAFRRTLRLDGAGGPLAAGLALAAAALLAQNLFSPDLRFGVSAFLAFFCLGSALGLSAEPSLRESPLPEFPGRYGLAALGAAALLAWGSLAAQPMLAQRRLSRQPGFHVQPSQELSEALRILEERLRAEPGNADLAESLAFAYAKEKSWDLAMDRFELAARLAPARPGPLNNLGNIQYSLGNLPRAIAYWERSVVVAPDQIDAHLNLGKALYETGKLKESSSHLQAVLRQDPANEKAQILLKKMIE